MRALEVVLLGAVIGLAVALWRLWVIVSSVARDVRVLRRLSDEQGAFNDMTIRLAGQQLEEGRLR